MTRIIDTPKALLVELPEGSYDPEVSESTLYYMIGDTHTRLNEGRIKLLPQYSYGQPIPAGEMGEEDLLNILEFWDSATGGGDYQDYYKNYETETPENYMHLFHFTCPEESFASLLRSHNLRPETTVVIPKKKLMEKNLYVSITSGEETFYFTKENALLLLSKEFDRVESENGQHEFAYEWDWHWLTEEEYIELTRNPDTPTFPTEDVEESGDEMWQELIHEVEQHQKRQTEYPDVINELKSQYKLIKK